jgi:hypothetical protein
MPATRSGSKNSNGAGSKGAAKSAVGRARSAGELDSQHLEGREPSHEPDVFVDIRKVKVDEVYVDVEHLEAHLALQAKLANLLQVVAGVHVHLGKVEVDIKGVEAEALLKVRLENLYDILDRALTTLDRNPEILESLVHTLDDTVGQVGQLGEKALGPGGAVSQTLGDVGQAVGGLGQGLGQGVGGLGEGLGGVGQGLGQTAGQAGQALGGVGQAAGGAAGASGQASDATGQQQQQGKKQRSSRQTKRGTKRGSKSTSTRSSAKRSSTASKQKASSRRRS